VRVIVPFPPGGGTDTVARPLSAKLTQLTGQQFVIDNRGGAGGTLGAAAAAKATPDGYTVLLSPVHVAVAVSAYKNLPYDLEKDLVPVTTVAVFPDVLMAANRVPAKTLPELIAYAKANPGKINCGSAGNGTTRHLACEMFNSAAGIKAVHVPYKGTGPATTALLGGEIDYIFEALGSAAPHIRSGKLRAIAVTSSKRSPSFPEIPTAAESGLPGFDVTSWYGLWVPAGTPPAVVQRLHALVLKAFEDAETRELWFKLGADAGGMPPEAFAAFVRSEVQKWGKVVRDAGVTIE
jgi:tripartite-type tricarboxylate transporter receptor subunit TctC